MRATYTGAVLLQALLATANPFRRHEQPTTKSSLTLRARSPTPFQDPSPNTISPQTVNLRRRSGRFARTPDYKQTSPRIGTGPLELDLGLGALIADVEIGNQSFGLVFDTGSSDLWVASEDYVCVSVANASVVDRDVCNVTHTFRGSYSGGTIPDVHLDVAYGAGAAHGTMGFEAVTLAGLTIMRQQMSIADLVGFPGLGGVSGVIGMAYPELTSAFLGNETAYPSDSRNTTQRPYDNLITNIFRADLTRPLFSLALDSSGGVFAVGGLPPVSFEPGFASTPILIVDVEDSHVEGLETKFSYYTIVPDGFVFGKAGSCGNGSAGGGDGHPSSSSPCKSPPAGRRRHVSSSRGTTAVPPLKSSRDLPVPDSEFVRLARTNHHHTTRGLDKTDVVGNNTFPTIVDSGTTFTNLPPAIVQALYAEFPAPPTLLPGLGAYAAPCNTTAVPTFGVQIGGKTFFMGAADLVLQQAAVGGGLCALGVQPAAVASGDGPTAPFVLGATFLQSVVAVFDVGAAEMRFASRSPSRC